MTDLIIKVGYKGLTQVAAFILTFIIVYYILEAIEFIFSFVRNTWTRYGFTLDIIFVTFIGAYLYFVTHLYVGYISTITLIIGSILYIFGDYIRSSWTHNRFIGNLITIVSLSFFFLENTDQVVVKCYMFAYTIIRSIYIFGIISISYLSKSFS